MLVGRHERILAIDGVYLHVRSFLLLNHTLMAKFFTDHAIGQTSHRHVRKRSNLLIPHPIRSRLPTISQILFIFQARRSQRPRDEEVRFRGGESKDCERDRAEREEHKECG